MEQQPDITNSTNPHDPVTPLGTTDGQGQTPLPGTETIDTRQYKTLGIRVDNDLHARLSFISQLRESTLSGEIIQAIRGHVDAAQADPDLIAKAEEVRTQIEREAEARRAAIAGMFGSTALTGKVDAPTPPSVRRQRRGDSQSAAN